MGKFRGEHEIFTPEKVGNMKFLSMELGGNMKF